MITTIIITVIIAIIIIAIINSFSKTDAQEPIPKDIPLITSESFTEVDSPINLTTAKLLYCSFMEYHNITYNAGYFSDQIKYRLEELKEESAYLKEQIKDLTEEKKSPHERIKSLMKEKTKAQNDETKGEIEEEILEYKKELETIDNHLTATQKKFDYINTEYRTLKTDKTDFLINHINTETHGSDWQDLMETHNIAKFENPQT
jgi:hypothetical protein